VKKAIFIDRDGTLIEEVGYLKMLEDLRFTPRATSALRIFSELGFLNIVITNQSAVARGILSPKELNKIHNKMRELAARDDARIDHVYYCPHLPGGRIDEYNVECDCRKPKAGMIFQAREKLGLDLQQCVMVGDKTSDLEVAANAGVRPVLVLTGYGAKTKSEWTQPVDCFTNLYEFALSLKQNV
jgi:D-glycero-D-manno-heptose 1,7-bisphosphate phosphatase